MSFSELSFSVLAGVALSACCGFRVFIPLLMACFGVRLGFMPAAWLSESALVWVHNDVFMVALTIAVVIEIAAYTIPVLDNILDAIATPLAVVAATLLSSSFFVFSDDAWIRLVLGAVSGGVAAGIIQTSTSTLRVGSTKFTAGLANPLFALIETVLAFVMSLIAVLLPVVGILLVIGACWGFLLMLKMVFRRRR